MDDEQKKAVRRAAKVLHTKEKPLAPISASILDESLLWNQPEAAPKQTAQDHPSRPTLSIPTKGSILPEAKEALEYLEQLAAEQPADRRKTLASCTSHVILWLDGQLRLSNDDRKSMATKLAGWPVKAAEAAEVVRRQTAADLQKTKKDLAETVLLLEASTKESERFQIVLKDVEAKNKQRETALAQQQKAAVQDLCGRLEKEKKAALRELEINYELKIQALSQELLAQRVEKEKNITQTEMEWQNKLANLRTTLSTRHKEELEKAIAALDSQQAMSHAAIVSKYQTEIRLLTSENTRLAGELERSKEKLMEEQQAINKRLSEVDSTEHRLLMAMQRLEADRSAFDREKQEIVHVEVNKRVEEMRFELANEKGKEIEFIVERLALEKDRITESSKKEIEILKKDAAKTKLALESENARLSASVKALDTELKETRKNHLQTISDLESQNKSLKDNILTRLQKELNLKSEMIASQNSRVVSLNGKIGYYEQAMAEKTEEIASLRAVFQQLTAKFDQREADIEAEITAVEARCKAVLTSKEENIGKLKAEVAKLRAVIHNDLEIN